MKRIKIMLLLVTVLILGFSADANADTCNSYSYFKNEGKNEVKPGDIIEVEAGFCFGEQGEESHFDLEFDRDAFTLITDNPFVNPGCDNIKDFQYVAEGDIFSTKFKQDSCGLIKLNYKFKVKDVSSKTTSIKGTSGVINFDIINSNSSNDYVSGLNYLDNIAVDSNPDFIISHMGTFNKFENSFIFSVPNSTERITISGTPEGSKAKVYGLGEKKLVVGENRIYVLVVAENGDINKYLFEVNREDESGLLSSEGFNEYYPDIPNTSDTPNTNEEVLENDPVNIYLFYGEGCPHCADLETFFDSIEDEYGKYYNLVKYEVWYNESNSKLFGEVLKRMNTNTEKTGVPYLVIGDSSIMGYGNTEEENEEIINTIMRVYNSSTRYDAIEDKTINTEDEKNEIAEEPNGDPVKGLKKLNLYLEIVSGCCILVIVLFVGFVIVNNRKKNDEEKGE